MDTMAEFKYSCLDFVLTLMGLCFLLLDIALDIWAVVTFYQEKAYVSLVILVLLLVVSSVLAQVFSWLWYRDEEFVKQPVVKSLRLSPGKVKLLHVLQCGIYFRHAGVVELSLGSLCDSDHHSEGFAVFLTHDLSMLRIIEAFSESAPQLVLMLAIILRQSKLDPVTVLKAFGSASAIAFSLTMYHRSLRSFLPDKKKQDVVSSLVYYLWNLCLLLSRLVALALFASVLPCFIFTHFLCSWLVLFFFVWRSKTDFMDSPGGEWLYRTTVGLIWYFCWFNVAEGRTLRRTLIYHSFIVADISLLCSLWCWKMLSMELPFFPVSAPVAAAVASCVVSVYVVGLALKMLYYGYFHPNIAKEELKGHKDEGSTDEPRPETMTTVRADVEESHDGEVHYRQGVVERDSDQRKELHYNKRMRKLAGSFYCNT